MKKILEKGYVFRLDYAPEGGDGEKIVRLDLPRWSWIMLHDPSGRALGKSRVMVMRGKLYNDTPLQRKPSKIETEYYGNGVELFEGTLPMARGIGDWEPLGVLTWIWYDRVGEFEDPFEHDFNLDYQPPYPLLFTKTMNRRRYYMIDCGSKAVINWRGFVKP